MAKFFPEDDLVGEIEEHMRLRRITEENMVGYQEEPFLMEELEVAVHKMKSR